MKKIKIRQARIEDVKQIAKVHHKSAFNAYNDPNIINPEVLQKFWNEETLKKDWIDYLKHSKDNKDLISLVAVENGKIVGVMKSNSANTHEEKDVFEKLGITGVENDYIHFKSIYIDPAHQKKGIGKQFINHVAKVALKKGKKGLMTLTADKYENSPKFFKSFGAQCVGHYTLDVGEHIVSGQSANHDDVVCKVWFMDSKEVYDKSTDKEKKLAYLKASKNKQRYRMDVVSKTVQKRATLPVSITTRGNQI